MSEPRYALSDFNTIPGYAVTDNGREEDRDSWLPLNLAYLPDEPPVQPTLGFGLVYPGRRHVFSGPQESAKTLAAYAIGLDTIRNGSTVTVIDFEMGKYTARNRLRELGATTADFGHLLYIEPHEPATTERIGTLIALNPVLVIVDAAAGAYDLQGLDDNKRQDVEKFTHLYVRGFWQAGIATIVLDHVVKDAESRGKYAIGSERKTGGVDVHLGFDTITPIKRGTTGLYKIVTHKDRDGFLQRGRIADLHLSSDPITHTIRCDFKPVDPSGEERTQLPTVLMERVSHYLEEQTEPISRNQIVLNVKGNAEFVRAAIDHLVALRFVVEEGGSNRARLYSVERPFIRSEWEETQVRPSSSQVRPNELESGSSDRLPPQGETDEPTERQDEQFVHTEKDEPEQELDDDDRAFLARLQHEPDPTDEIPF